MKWQAKSLTEKVPANFSPIYLREFEKDNNEIKQQRFGYNEACLTECLLHRDAGEELFGGHRGGKQLLATAIMHSQRT